MTRKELGKIVAISIVTSLVMGITAVGIDYHLSERRVNEIVTAFQQMDTIHDVQKFSEYKGK